jgi:hypothetical protein
MTNNPRRIHDYSLRYWGHDFTLQPDADPVTARIAGWGHGLREHDLLLIPRQAGGKCIYEIETLRWASNVDDMWFAGCRFVPVSSELGQQVVAALDMPPIPAPPELELLTGWRVLDV